MCRMKTVLWYRDVLIAKVIWHNAWRPSRSPGKLLCLYSQESHILLLHLQKFTNTLLSECDQRIHRNAAKNATFTCSLHFDKLVFGCHYHVKVDISMRIFFVTKIEHNVTANDAYTHCGHGCTHRVYG